MDNDQIKHMVNRFLMWKLPEHFRPDCGIIYTPIRIADGRLLEPSGTNLLDATQAEAMVRHMIEGLPAARPASGEREGEADWTKRQRLRRGSEMDQLTIGFCLLAFGQLIVLVGAVLDLIELRRK